MWLGSSSRPTGARFLTRRDVSGLFLKSLVLRRSHYWFWWSLRYVSLRGLTSSYRLPRTVCISAIISIVDDLRSNYEFVLKVFEGEVVVADWRQSSVLCRLPGNL